jgi:hypothetical protein
MQVMVFMGGTLRLSGRGGFSNPDRSGHALSLVAQRVARRSGLVPTGAGRWVEGLAVAVDLRDLVAARCPRP